MKIGTVKFYNDARRWSFDVQEDRRSGKLAVGMIENA